MKDGWHFAHHFLREESMRTLNRPALYVIVAGLLAILSGGKAFSQADFYKGKTIKIIRGGGPGGSGEFQTRALVRFLEKYIPGKPNLMVEFIEGAAGRKAANVIFSSTRPDGLTIGSIGAGLVVGPILGLPGSNYDLDKFIYLGSTDAGDPYIFYTKGDLGLDTIEKLRAKSGLRLGAHAVGHPVYVTARMAAYLLGLKDPKFVTGYTGPEIYIALTRGELDAHATGAARFVVEQPEWIEKKLVHFHATLTVPKGRHHPRLRACPNSRASPSRRRNENYSTCSAPSSIRAGRTYSLRERPKSVFRSSAKPCARRLRIRNFPKSFTS